jgi:hypothetical protein
VDFFDGNIGNGITGGGSTAENGAQSLTAGVNWYANSRTRLMFNWSQYWYETRLGTPFGCNQAACGAGNLKAGCRERSPGSLGGRMCRGRSVEPVDRSSDSGRALVSGLSAGQ